MTRLGSLFRRQADTPAGVLEAAKRKHTQHHKISFLFGVASWQVRTVGFRECNLQSGHTVPGTKVFILGMVIPPSKENPLLLGIQTPTLIGLMR